MARCEDCIYHKMCYWIALFNEKTPCEHFISSADVAPRSEEGAECPTCHGTGRIGTTDWLTKNISKEQLAKEKAEAIAEHELHIKQDYAREIFADIKKVNKAPHGYICLSIAELEQIEKKYTEGET